MKTIKLILEKLNELTIKQKILLIVITILPGGSLILIFSPLGQQIIQKLTREKTSKTFGKLKFIVTNEEIYRDLYE